MEYLLLCIVFLVIQPADSFGLEILTNHLPHSLLIGVGVSACILPACYIFYPAYCANVEGELGCTCTVLAGRADEKKGSQGERYKVYIKLMYIIFIPLLTLILLYFRQCTFTCDTSL